jgi:hypothetical protein
LRGIENSDEYALVGRGHLAAARSAGDTPYRFAANLFDKLKAGSAASTAGGLMHRNRLTIYAEKETRAAVSDSGYSEKRRRHARHYRAYGLMHHKRLMISAGKRRRLQRESAVIDRRYRFAADTAAATACSLPV